MRSKRFLKRGIKSMDYCCGNYILVGESDGICTVFGWQGDNLQTVFE